MTLFAYKAVDATGRRRHGRMVADSPADLECRLKNAGLDFINAREARRRLFGARRIPRREIINFCFTLRQLLEAGVPLLDSLCDLRDGLEHADFQLIAAALVESIRGGKSFSQALGEHPEAFDGVFCSLVQAGEISGKLPFVLGRLTDSLCLQDELASHTKKLMIYPALSGGVVIAVCLFMLLSLVPQLGGFIQSSGQEIPLHTRFLLQLSNFLVQYAWLVLPAIPLAICMLALAVRGSPALRRRVDAWQLQLPVFGGVLKKITLARFASTFAMLYASGITVIDAIRATQGVVRNTALNAAIRLSLRQIEDGQGIARAFRETGLFPSLVIRMLHVGESTGSLDRSLDNVAYFFNRDVRESIQRLQALIEPVMTLVIGLLLGWIMLSVLGPIYDVITRMKT